MENILEMLNVIFVLLEEMKNELKNLKKNTNALFPIRVQATKISDELKMIIDNLSNIPETNIRIDISAEIYYVNEIVRYVKSESLNILIAQRMVTKEIDELKKLTNTMRKGKSHGSKIN